MPKRLPVGKRALLEDCLILLVSLVLTEPKTTKRQHRLIPKLIQRLRKELAASSSATEESE